MNKTISSLCSNLSASQSPKKNFRTIVKNRHTHEIADPETDTNYPLVKPLRSTIEQEDFQEAKNNLKRYIKNMKATSKLSNYQNQPQTNRSSFRAENPAKLKTSRVKQSMTKSMNKSLSSSFHIKEDFTDKTQNQTKSFVQKLPIQVNKRQHSRCMTQNIVQMPKAKLPMLQNNSNLEENYQQTVKDLMKIQTTDTSQRQRLCELEGKIQFLLSEKLKVISTDSSINPSKQHTNANKLLEKQMDRILGLIRKVKLSQENLFKNQNYQQAQKDLQINRNIEMLQKKVRILERLIAQKIFQADNLKNQYLQKVKFHKRNASQAPHNKRSKSTTFYRQANTLNPANFKPRNIKKEAIINSDQTTNKATYQKPLQSYYIAPRREYFYNGSKLNQPMPRSSYNREYLIYGTIPKHLISMKYAKRDNAIFNNSLSASEKKDLLKGSTYKQDFISKIQKQPINFRELDCYRNKIKSLQVNYGKQKNNNKVVNSNSVNQFRDQTIQIRMLQSQTQNQQSILPTLRTTNDNKSQLKSRLDGSVLKQTQNRISMMEQEQIQKHHLFNQRIKAEIKHKNVHDQKYKFKNDLLKVRNSQADQTMYEQQQQKRLKTFQY